MQQKIAPKNKRKMWSVYIFTKRDVQKGRSIVRRKRLNQTRLDKYISGQIESVLCKFLYLEVIKICKKKGFLYIQMGVGKKKEVHIHDVKDIINIQIREHKRDGVQ